MIKQRDENQQVNVEIEEEDAKEGTSLNVMEVDKPVVISDSSSLEAMNKKEDTDKLRPQAEERERGEKLTPIDLTGSSASTSPRTGQQDKEKEICLPAVSSSLKTRARRESLTLLPKPQQQDSPYSCLLYTSPSPRDATLSRMPSSA